MRRAGLSLRDRNPLQRGPAMASEKKRSYE